MADRWKYVRDASKLRTELARYDTVTPPPPDPAADRVARDHKVTLITWEEARRNAAALKSYLNGETDNQQIAVGAATGLGILQQYGFKWQDMG